MIFDVIEGVFAYLLAL